MDKRTYSSEECDLKLVCFLYDLMRDHLPTGVVHGVVADAQTTKDGEPLAMVTFTNSYLADYAHELAGLLT